MNKVEKLKVKLIRAELVEATRKEQVAKAQERLEIIIAKSNLGHIVKRLTREWREAVEHTAELENQVRAAALTYYTETDDKKPAIGVEIQNTVVTTVTDMSKAIAYAQVHAPKLIVTKPKNASSFKAWLKRQVKVDDVSEFVTLIEGVKVVLKKRLWEKNDGSG